MLEALALARDLADQHLWGHEAATALRDDYAARLWLCLALARRALSAWFGLIAEALPGAYADGALLRSAEDRDVLLALVAPLEHLAFELHGRPDSVAQVLSLQPDDATPDDGEAADADGDARRLKPTTTARRPPATPTTRRPRAPTPLPTPPTPPTPLPRRPSRLWHSASTRGGGGSHG